MPVVRPFRALRYDPAVVGDLGAVMAPPYDVVSPEAADRYRARDPRNVIRLDLPTRAPGDDAQAPYGRAAATLQRWVADGVLRRDDQAAVYAYEQTYRLPGAGPDAPERRRLGFFAAVGLEAFGPMAGIRRHERTLTAPKEDRYRLLGALGVNTSPIVGMYDDPTGTAGSVLAGVAATSPVVDLDDDAGVRHRLWVVAPDSDAAAALCNAAGGAPITIADGHHRYETALRYRDERRSSAGVGPDAPVGTRAEDMVLMLLLEPVAGPLDVLGTHRLVRGLGPGGVASFLARFDAWFESSPASPAELRVAFRAGGGPGGAGRFGLWTRDGGWRLRARADARARLAASGRAADRLDVRFLEAVLEDLAGIDAAAVAAGDRLAYTHDAGDAIAAVDARRDDSDLAILLDGTPASAIAAVAAEGDVMPQKSTYIYPKALTGLVLNPLDDEAPR